MFFVRVAISKMYIGVTSAQMEMLQAAGRCYTYIIVMPNIFDKKYKLTHRWKPVGGLCLLILLLIYVGILFLN